MPIIKRLTGDMLSFQDAVDAYIVPVNLTGTVSSGIGAEFRKRAPDYVDIYQEACRSKELRIGTLKIIDDLPTPYDLWCLPTKDHYANISEKIDILRGMEALRDTLNTEKYKHMSIGLPMLAGGPGALAYDEILTIMEENLQDLEATIFLSMSPQRTEYRSEYLVIVGPPDWGLTPDDKCVIDDVVAKVMAHWDKDITEYTNIVSGGYPGVDSYVCGESFNDFPEDTLAHRLTGKAPLVIQPNLSRNAVTAAVKHHHLLCEIADDIIIFKPKGHNNNRLSMMQIWLEQDKAKREAQGDRPRRVAVWGEKEPEMHQEKLIIDVKEGKEYDDEGHAV